MSGIKPITREESFLAKLGGQDVTTPEPITRTEQFLQAIIDNGAGGGGGGTGGGVFICNVNPDTGALDKTAKELYDAMDNAIVLFKASTTPADGVVYDVYSYVCSRTTINNSLYAFTYGSILADFPYDGFENAPFSGDTYPILSVSE